MKDSKIALMPDAHAGKGSVVGTTIQLDKDNLRLVPNLVGVDISCGMLTVKLNVKSTEIDLKLI